MKPSQVYTAIFLGMLTLGALAQQAQNPQPHMPMPRQTSTMSAMAPAPAEALKITFGDKSATWTVATLAALPHVTVTVYNEHTKANETYSGVPLMALLAPLGMSEHPRGKDLRLYVVAEGSDLYEVVYSSGEITPEVNSSTVIVADTENGKALASDGPLKLIATGEKRPARWVRSLVAIKVFTAE
ncbi:MAG: hypothetical protein WAL45_21060 [Terracidiphilus sp.]